MKAYESLTDFGHNLTLDSLLHKFNQEFDDNARKDSNSTAVSGPPEPLLEPHAHPEALIKISPEPPHGSAPNNAHNAELDLKSEVREPSADAPYGAGYAGHDGARSLIESDEY